MADRPAHHLVLEEAARDLVDELQAEDVPGPDAGDALQVFGTGLEDPAEGLELLERLAGRPLAVPPGRAEGQQELDDLVVQKGGQPPVEELLSQAVPMPDSVGGPALRPVRSVVHGVLIKRRPAGGFSLAVREKSVLVEEVDQRLENLLDDVALDLERRGQLRVGVEIAFEKDDLLDPLVGSQVGRRPVDLGQHEARDLVPLDELLAAGEGDALRPGVGLELVEVRHDQRGDELPSAADDDGRPDIGVRLEEVLDRLGGDVLAAGRDQDVLLPVGDDEEALLVDVADVAGLEPAVLEGLAGLLLLLVIALHDVRPLGQDLAVRGDLDLDAGDRRPNGPELHLVEGVAGQDGRRLRHAVALEDGQADGVEELGHVGRQRSAAGDKEMGPAARLLDDLAVDELGRDLFLQPEPPWDGPVADLAGAVFLADPDGPEEDLPLERRLGQDVVHDLGVDLVEEPGDADHDRRPDLEQVPVSYTHLTLPTNREV